jgi:hypothetical protein
MLQNQKNAFEESISKELRKQVDNLIRDITKKTKDITSCEFNIPPFMFGRAVYDPYVVRERLLSSLHRDGYEVYIHDRNPLKIGVSWEEDEKPMEIAKVRVPRSLQRLKQLSKTI